ncbi:hypothetical protein [Streptomyces sp. XH2]|uniref:hypothetical protein n=1 Tax=Streptomyces sp. XH2 TaxID=3412483 RepID=UPI003C7E22C9
MSIKQIQREIAALVGHVIPADDQITLAQHAQFIDGELCFDREGVRIVAKYAPDREAATALMRDIESR